MTVTRVADHLHMISRRGANAYLLEADDGLTVIDTGWPGTDDAILAAVTDLGRPASDVRHILLTHAHIDHLGSAAALKRATGARVLIHAADRGIAERGDGPRRMRAAPSPVGLLFPVMSALPVSAEPVPIDGEMADGDVLPIAGGLEVIDVPGHCAGQVALRWQRHGILFAADACTHFAGLGDPIGFEDEAAGRRSQARLAGLDFDTACFGHGRPIIGDAAVRFRRKWGGRPSSRGPLVAVTVGAVAAAVAIAFVRRRTRRRSQDIRPHRSTDRRMFR